MPGPVSATWISSRSPARSAITSTRPSAVNFSALDSRLFRICLSRSGSQTRVSGTSGAIDAASPSPLPVAVRRKKSIVPSTSGLISTGSGASVIEPASTFARSRISPSSSFRYSAALRISPACSRNFGCSSRCSISSEKPRMLVSGVRSSCEIAARNALLASLAALARDSLRRSAALYCSSRRSETTKTSAPTPTAPLSSVVSTSATSRVVRQPTSASSRAVPTTTNSG